MSGDCDHEMKAMRQHNDDMSIMNAAPSPGEVFNDVRLYVPVTYMVHLSRACQICRPVVQVEVMQLKPQDCSHSSHCCLPSPEKSR